MKDKGLGLCIPMGKKEIVVLGFIKFERGKVNKNLGVTMASLSHIAHKSILILYKITLKNGFQCPVFLYHLVLGLITTQCFFKDWISIFF